MICQSDDDQVMVVSEGQFGTNHHDDIMKDIVIGGISGDGFLSAR
jgi:hypothetical protein